MGQVALVLNNLLSHESVPLLDATFSEVAGVAEVLAPCATSRAVRVRTRAPHRGYNQVAYAKVCDALAQFDHFGERLVSDDQAVLAGRRRPVMLVGNLAISAAHANFESTQKNFATTRCPWFRQVFNSRTTIAWVDGKRSHGPSSVTYLLKC